MKTFMYISASRDHLFFSGVFAYDCILLQLSKVLDPMPWQASKNALRTIAPSYSTSQPTGKTQFRFIFSASTSKSAQYKSFPETFIVYLV